MKHKTADLSGALLDAAVAVAEGARFGRELSSRSEGYRAWPLSMPGWETLGSATLMPNGEWSGTIKPYGRDWAIGGPIIERERISVSYSDIGGTERGGWTAYVEDGPLMFDFDRPLVAAMRAFVASRLGEEIELP